MKKLYDSPMMIYVELSTEDLLTTSVLASGGSEPEGIDKYSKINLI